MNSLSGGLAASGGRINLVFHDIVKSTTLRQSAFDIALDEFHSLCAWLIETDLARGTRLYFDDNLRSFFDLILTQPVLAHFESVILSVPVGSIGQPGRGDRREVECVAQSTTIELVPHGFSHIRLASYDTNGRPILTPLGGRYADKMDEPLSENEVLFQLGAPREISLFRHATEFVLPYGCFNATTVALNERFGLYRYLSRADRYVQIDRNQQLRPRVLVEADSVTDVLPRMIQDAIR